MADDLADSSIMDYLRGTATALQSDPHSGDTSAPLELLPIWNQYLNEKLLKTLTPTGMQISIIHAIIPIINQRRGRH